MIKDVLRLKRHGRLSHEAIARSLLVLKGVVAKYVALGRRYGLEPLGGRRAAGPGRTAAAMSGVSAEQRRVAQPAFSRRPAWWLSHSSAIP